MNKRRKSADVLKTRLWTGPCLALSLFVSTRAGLALDPSRDIAQYVHDSWSTKDGIPEGSVFALLPTSDGYLWIGAQDGLLRFDGHGFRRFGSGQLGLRQNGFGRDLLEASDGAIWAALIGGVARYSGGKFEFYDENQGLSHPFVYALAPGPSGSIWIGTGGIGVLSLSKNTFQRHPAYVADPSLPGKVHSLSMDDDTGTLWVATDRGTVALNSVTRVFTTNEGLPSDVVNFVRTDRRKGVWMGTRGGLARWNGVKFDVYTTANGLPDNDITAFVEDRDDNLWFGTRAGQLVRMAQGKFDVSAPFSDPWNGGVFALAEDATGSVWFGTGRGLSRLRDGAFVTLGRKQGLQNVQILNVARRSAGGIWVLDGAGSLLVFDNAKVRSILPPGSITGEGMLGMLEDADGSLWIGGRELHRFRDGILSKIQAPVGEVSVILPDGDAMLVAATSGDGTSTLWHFAEGRFTPFPIAAALTHVQRLYRDSQRRLWIATGGGGLVRLDRDKVHVFRKADGLPHDVVYGLDEDYTGAIWVATRGGLAQIKNDHVENLVRAPSLPSNSPIHLQHDAQGFLWITEHDGIYRVSLDELNALAEHKTADVLVERFTTADGLESVEVSWRCSAQTQTEDGRLWYATSRGFSTVSPSHLGTRKRKAPAHVEMVLVDGHIVPQAPTLSIRHGRERIEFRYSAPELAQPELMQFRYQLVGFDPQWVDAGPRRAAYYTNIPPGAYVFNVAARRANGPWTNTLGELRLRIEPYWYETWPAKLFLVGGALLSLSLLYRLRIRQLRKREKLLVQKVTERTEELRLEIEERRNAELEVRRLNESLEMAVLQRTAKYAEALEHLAADITQRKLVEAALADEKERLTVTLRSIAEGVISTDEKGNVALMNAVAERLTGYPSAEAEGAPIAEVFSALERTTRRRLDCPVHAVLSGRGAQSAMLNRVILTSRTGRESLLDVSAAAICDRKSRIVGAVLVFRDVTEKTRIEDQVQKNQKLEAIGLLAGGIAHDFNNLLTGLFGHIDLARASLTPDAPALIWLNDAVDVLEHAQGLARQLLTFSAGGRPATEPISLSAIMQRSARFVLSGSNVAAEVIAQPDLWPCDLDPLQIRQAIDNLILNARQAMVAGGHIRLIASNVYLQSGEVDSLDAGRYVELRIEDEGPGISPEIRERIFDPFFTTKATGTGLGLATVCSIITKHGGHIALASGNERGATFVIHLKATELARLSEPAREARRPSGFSLTNARILVMDDEPLIRKVTRSALKDKGYRVEVASNGREALEVFSRGMEENQAFDLVILDLTVAGGPGGLETLVELKKLNPKIRAIASSGYSSGPVLSDPTAFGFIGKLPKPFKMSDLTAAVRLALDHEFTPSEGQLR